MQSRCGSSSEPSTARSGEDGSWPRNLGRLQRGTLALATAGMLIYIGVAIVSDWPTVSQGVATLGAGGVALILTLSLLNYGLRFLRWHLFAVKSGHRVPVGRHCAYYVGGFAFTVSPAKAGEAVRSMFLLRHGVPLADSVALLLVERLLDLLAVAVLATLIASQGDSYRYYVIGTLAATLALIAATGSGAIGKWLDRAPSVVPAGIRNLSRWFATTLQSAARLMTLRLVLVGLAIGIVSWAAEGVGLWILVRGLGFPIDIGTAIAVYAVAVLAGAVIFILPAGIGGTEVAMTALLVATGVPLGGAIVATALCRIATLWFAVALGIGSLGFLHVSGPGAEAPAQAGQG